MIEKHSKVFVPVSVDIRLPDKSGIYLFKLKQGSGVYKPHSFDISYQDLLKNLADNWLEEKENVYVLTEQELIKLMSEFMYQLRIGTYEMYSANNGAARAFLQSKTNPQTENNV